MNLFELYLKICFSFFQAFVEVRTACDNVRLSSRFQKMLELILTVGNYMNSSAKSYEPVHGFDISFLPKVNR